MKKNVCRECGSCFRAPKHYQAKKYCSPKCQYGAMGRAQAARLSFAERFAKFTSPEPNSGCWLWSGVCNGAGYGQMAAHGKRNYYAHRFAYENFVGAIPDGYHIDHLCRTPCCVNPAHLEPVTQRENTLRGLSPAAKQAQRSHCIQGHPLSGSNLYLTRSKRRQCRACSSRRARERYHAMKDQGAQI